MDMEIVVASLAVWGVAIVINSILGWIAGKAIYNYHYEIAKSLKEKMEEK